MRYLQNSAQSRHVAYSAALKVMSEAQLLSLSKDLGVTSDVAELRSALDAQGEPCIKVEYHETSIDAPVVKLAYVPLSLIDECAAISPGNAVHAAFHTHTHIPAVHMVRYDQDELFTAAGQAFLGADMLDRFGRGATAQMLSEKYGHESNDSGTTLLTVDNPDGETEDGETEEMDLRICGSGEDAHFVWITEYGDPIGDAFYLLDEAGLDVSMGEESPEDIINRSCNR